MELLLQSVGIASPTQMWLAGGLLTSTILSIAFCIRYRNKARVLRCRSEWIAIEDIPEHDRLVRIRDRLFVAGIAGILGVLGVINVRIFP